MSALARRFAAAVAKLREWANDYEPATARATLAALVQAASLLGIKLGDLPQKANAALGVLAILATIIAGRSIRKAVTKPATVQWLHRYTSSLEAGATEDQLDLAVQHANRESG